jgi:hypothetical protein
MRARSSAVIPALAAMAVVVAGGAHGMGGGSCSVGQVLKTKSYVFALSIGPLEQMYTPAQVKARHPMNGEVMLSGSMSGGMSGMGMSGTAHHLEVHICTSKGAVLMHAHPTIVVDDPMAQATRVPVATMEGVDEGPSDYHYGNNVALANGHRVTVTVTLAGQKAVFHATVTKSGVTGMAGMS